MKKLLLLFMITTVLLGCSNAAKQNADGGRTIDVKLSFEVENISTGKPKIVGQTNLPDGTDLMIYLRDRANYNAGQVVKVQGGTFTSPEFSMRTNPLTKNLYIATVTMQTPSSQPPDVQERIGKQGENLRGEPVVKTESGVSVQARQEFEIK